LARLLQVLFIVESHAPSATPHPRLAVLGGGISGLAATFWLSEWQPQADITVLEASDRLGGLIGTIRERGYLLETGPLAFPTGAPATAELISRSGLASRCLPSRSAGGIGLWDGRRVVPAPKTAWDVLRRRLLSPRALARLLMEPFIPRTPEGQDVSIREFFRRRTGEEFFACLLEPMAAGILAGDPSTLSISANLPRFSAMERDSGSLATAWLKERLAGRPRPPRPASCLPPASTTPDGCAGLVEGIAQELRRRGVRLETGCAIRSLGRRRDVFQVQWRRAGRENTGDFDGVIAALPAPALGALDADWPEGVHAFLKGIPHVSLSPVYLAFPIGSSGAGFAGEGILPQPRSGEEFLSCFLPSRMAEGRCPPGQILLRFLLGGSRKAHLADLSPGQAGDLAGHAARRMLACAGGPVFARALRHPDCLPQLVVGHADALARCRETLRRAWPGFHLAGTSFQGPGIENAVASGRKAAAEAARMLHPAPASVGG
jgi:protoporphyrinogen/coproporphyrinogen III oxidase